MKQICYYIVERLHINKDIGKHIEYNYHPTSRNELKQLVNKLINERGYNADLNDIDTSEITDMNFMFSESKFTGENGDISKWDVSNVKNMKYMFYDTPLYKNQPKWYKLINLL